jgi:heme-degrading monooxygenase HmoA
VITHLVIHFPHPEHRDAVLASMNRVGAAAAGQPGLVRIDAWSELEGERLVGLAIWETMEAFEAARPKIFAVVADDPFDVWLARESDGMILEA